MTRETKKKWFAIYDPANDRFRGSGFHESRKDAESLRKKMAKDYTFGSIYEQCIVVELKIVN